MARPMTDGEICDLIESLSGALADAVDRIEALEKRATLHTECGTCQGSGVVTAPEWLAYDARCKQARQEWLAANPGCGWYSSREGGEWEAGYPDEAEVRCGDCRGTGCQLTPAGRELLFFLSTHRSG